MSKEIYNQLDEMALKLANAWNDNDMYRFNTFSKNLLNSTLTHKSIEYVKKKFRERI